MQDLGSLGGTVTQQVVGPNERGQVAGATTLAGDLTFHPFLWDGKKLIDLGTLGGQNGEAQWLNDAGDVVGSAQYTVACPNGLGGIHAFVWRKGMMTDLGTSNGLSNSEALSINSRRRIVGLSFNCDFSVVDASLWEEGSVVDLNTLISPHPALHLSTATYINDRGEITALGSLPNGDQRAVLLIPCDDDHPGLEGCDYSMVDANASPDQSQARAAAVGGSRLIWGLPKTPIGRQDQFGVSSRKY
jgi:probable HAF family extracellular repeat protein